VIRQLSRLHSIEVFDRATGTKRSLREIAEALEGQTVQIVPIWGQSNTQGVNSGDGVFSKGASESPHPRVQVYDIAGIRGAATQDMNFLQQDGDNVGPSLAFCKELAQASPGQKVIGVGRAAGATSFSGNHWNPGNTWFNLLVNDTNTLIASLKAAGVQVSIPCTFGEIGESDAIAGGAAVTGFAAAIDAKIAAVRAGLAPDSIGTHENLTYVLFTLPDDWVTDPAATQQQRDDRAAVQAAILDTPNRVHNVVVVDARDLPSDPGEIIHYTGDSGRTIGRRAFQKLWEGRARHDITARVFTATEKAKLAGIAALAEVNAATSLGAGQPIFLDKSGANLRFQSLGADNYTTVATSSNQVIVRPGGYPTPNLDLIVNVPGLPGTPIVNNGSTAVTFQVVGTVLPGLPAAGTKANWRGTVWDFSAAGNVDILTGLTMDAARFSVACWFAPKSLPATGTPARQHLMANKNGAANNGWSLSLMPVGSDPNIEWFLSYGHNADLSTLVGDHMPRLRTNNWYFAVAVYEADPGFSGGLRRATLYLNGNLVGSQVVAAPTSLEIQLGGQIAAQRLNAYADRFMVWNNVALTEPQVRRLFMATQGVNPN
jgi:hypothetical protein